VLIPYGRQDITDDDVDAVRAVLGSDFLTQGPAVPAFERAVAAKTQAAHAVALNSATSALHVACLALGLGPGDRLWTSPNTFVASANCGLYCGARLDFVDVDPDTLNLSVAALTEKLQQAAREGTLPKIVVPVHFAGQPPEQEAISALSKEYGFRVLEDASHAIGASRHDEPVGSGKWSDVTVFSFHPVKIITTGEGGMALTNDPDVARRMALLRTHGITRDAAQFAEPAPGDWYYEQQMLGFNYRMTDIEAALGLSQLSRLDTVIERRAALARRYDDLLAGLPIAHTVVLPGNRSSHHLHVIRVPGGIRRTVFDHLRRGGVGANVHYMPVHLQPFFRRLGFGEGLCPEAELYGREAITLPLHTRLTESEQDQIVTVLREALAEASLAN
jgi:UDP-4-amino-4,6-dideoxy-N-acetyl-beta-L-altrosamine transaminase